ncbi:MAG: peptide chain release factor 3 [Deltaproteobacteria bacterium]|nr:peptide chain release factor 3 [Deltaproteobacteria bacterium]
MPTLAEEVERRRTFAIISHPDAGKTTLTEKLLLYGGAIHLAGAIKAKKAARHATSDWMEIEKERGISVTSSVMQFDYRDRRINLLDTPGHQDFSEDTYRTLSAADSAVMLIDNAKGVETQTKKLFEVCRLRGLPIFTFINKMDREGRDPLDLLSEVEQLLGIQCVAILWPIGMGRDFKGVYDREHKIVHLFDAAFHGAKKLAQTSLPIDDPQIPELLGERSLGKLKEDIELLDAAGTPFTRESFLNGSISPVFFGSAMTNFGVEPFLQWFIDLAPQPASYKVQGTALPPATPRFSAFVFKIQANMDPSHRDRIAFARICTGKFERNMTVIHPRLEKEMRLSKPLQFLAQERTLIDEAYAGDIIGLFDTGQLRIGDTLCTGKPPIRFDEVPHFSPEFFARVRVKDPLKRKQLKNGLDQLSEEGAIQVFYQYGMGEMDPIVGAVGVLQFEVLQYRLNNEYGAPSSLERLPFDIARWIDGDFDPKPWSVRERSMLLEDRDKHPMVLFKGEWSLRHAQNDFPKLKFLMTARAKLDAA